MDVPASGSPGSSDSTAGSRQLLSELALAAFGAVALTAERIDALADQIAARGGIASNEEARALLREQAERWREEGSRLSAQAVSRLAGLARELGLVTREELDELELRLAQLQHRLQLLESDSSPR